MPLPLGQGHVKAEGEGVEPGTVRSKVRLIARPLSPTAAIAGTAAKRWSGLTFRKAAVAGIEPASGRLTAAYPYQHGSHRNESQDGRDQSAGRPIGARTGDLVDPSQSRHPHLRYVLPSVARAGVEPAFSARRADVLDR